MNRNNDLHAFTFAQSIHTGVVIACFDAFCQTITKKTVVVVDNASIHRSEECEDRIPYWQKRGLIIKYLSPYSPELNLIEILWRRIKYTWLPFSAYECLNALSEALETSPSNVHLVLDFLGHYFRIRDVVTIFVCRSLRWFLLGTTRMLLVTSEVDVCRKLLQHVRELLCIHAAEDAPVRTGDADHHPVIGLRYL